MKHVGWAPLTIERRLAVGFLLGVMARLRRGIRPAKILLCVFLLLFVFRDGAADCVYAAETTGDPAAPVIRIVYPKEGQHMAPVDSTFILGSVTPGAQLMINGSPVPVYRTGGFLAFLPVDTGLFVFRLVAKDARGSATLDRIISVPSPLVRVPDSVLLILPETMEPSGRQVLMGGDFLEVSFHGTPGCSGRFRIEGVEGTFPMAEQSTRSQSLTEDPEAERDSVGQSTMLSGYYTGVWQVPADMKLDSARVWFCLSRDTTVADTLVRQGGPPVFCNYTECVRATSAGVISVNAEDVPIVVELDSLQILRFGPRLGYFSTFQPAGVRTVYAGERGDWVRLRLAPGYSAWAEKKKTRMLPVGTPVPGGRISYIRTRARQGWTDVTLDLKTRLAYKVIEDPENCSVRLLIFGATTNTDWVRYDARDDLIKRVDWNQTDPGVYTLTVHLAQGPLWGYEVTYTDNGLVLSVRHAPNLRRGLRGLRICVDAGHSLDPGAVGPTGFQEKDANLAIALALRRELERKGAVVVMTRTADVQVDLYNRPAIARAADVDLYISIHNNAVPDGINPYADNGSAAYYYAPRSHALAAAIHRGLVEVTGLPDYGLYHANFAVLRPTQYPSVLVECAFIILPEQEALLRDVGFQRRIAQGIVKGIQEHIASLQKRR